MNIAFYVKMSWISRPVKLCHLFSPGNDATYIRIPDIKNPVRIFRFFLINIFWTYPALTFHIHCGFNTSRFSSYFYWWSPFVIQHIIRDDNSFLEPFKFWSVRWWEYEYEQTGQAFTLHNLHVLFHIVSDRCSGSSFRTSASFRRIDLTNAGSLRRWWLFSGAGTR